MKTANVQTRIDLLRVALWLVLGLVLSSPAAFGQGSASIVGTITDPSGAVIPNAKITITGVDTGFVRTTTTNTTGNYSAPELPNGRYQLTIEVQGFKTYER